MKYILMLLGLLLVGQPCLAGCLSYYDVDPKNADKLLSDKLVAQDTKKQAVKVLKAGDQEAASRLWQDAAAKHPEPLVKASYLWNAACCLVATKDSNNDWRIDAKRASKVENSSAALTLLDEAKTQAESETPYCSGINRQEILRLITLVQKWVETYAVTE